MTGRLVSLVGGLAAGAALGWVFADRLAHHTREDLYSRLAWRRAAALTYSGRRPLPATVGLLRDYVKWEPVPLLRRRARQVLRRLEARLS